MPDRVHEVIIDGLSQRYGVPREIAEKYYQEALSELELLGGVTKYLHIFAERRTREALKEMMRGPNR